MSLAQKGATLVGWAGGLGYVARRCGCNALNAISMRHGVPFPPTTIEPRIHLFEPFMHHAGRIAEHYIGLGYGWWLDKWPERKRQAIVKSVERDKVMRSRVKAMIKNEVAVKPPKKARMIQMYRNMATQADIGPECYAVQVAVSEVFFFAQVTPEIDVTIGSGMNAQDLGDWMSRVMSMSPACFYERDGKSWDATMGPNQARWRLSLIRMAHSALADKLADGVNVSGFGVFKEGFLAYSVDATVKSGHNDTSLGNSLVNALISVDACVNAKVAASVLVTGDDAIVAIYTRVVNVGEMTSHEVGLGIVPEARVFTSPFSVSFISGVWYPNGNDFVFGPKIGRLLAKLWWTVVPPSPSKLAMFRHSVANGLWGTVCGIPILRAWVGGWGWTRETVTRRSVYNKVSITWKEDLLGFIALKYGLSGAAIVDCEDWLYSLERKPMLLVHPVITRMMEVDLADVAERPNYPYGGTV